MIGGFFCCFFFDDRYVGVVFFIILLLYDMYSIGIGRHYFVRFLLALVSSLLIAVSGWFVVSAEDFSLPSEYLPSECEEGFEPAPVSECLI